MVNTKKAPSSTYTHMLHNMFPCLCQRQPRQPLSTRHVTGAKSWLLSSAGDTVEYTCSEYTSTYYVIHTGRSGERGGLGGVRRKSDGAEREETQQDERLQEYEGGQQRRDAMKREQLSQAQIKRPRRNSQSSGSGGKTDRGQSGMDSWKKRINDGGEWWMENRVGGGVKRRYWLNDEIQHFRWMWETGLTCPCLSFAFQAGLWIYYLFMPIHISGCI